MSIASIGCLLLAFLYGAPAILVGTVLVFHRETPLAERVIIALGLTCVFLLAAHG